MPIQRVLQVVFAVVAAVLAAMFVLLDQMQRVQGESARWVAHTEQVISELGAVHAERVQIELATRGYLIDGNQDHAEAYRRTVAALEDHVRKVARLTADNRNQVRRIPELREAVRNRAEACLRLMAIRDSQGVAAAARAFAASVVNRDLDTLVTLREMADEEQTLLIVRDQQLQRSEQVLRIGCGASGALILVLLVAAYARFRKDLARRVSLESQLLQKNTQLEDASRLKSEFLAHMSHELRTPLNAVIGYTGTLLMKLPGPLNADQEKQLKTVQTSARHLLSLINDILDVAKIEAGRVEIKLEELSCREIIEQIASTLRPMAEAKNLALETKFPGKPVIARTDHRAACQILINIANNSIKFTDKGSVKLELRETASDGHPMAAVDIIDTGVGIRPQDQPRLFRAFEQVGAVKPREGTGLGLYVSGKLAALIGARVEFASEFGKGSRFTVLIPRA